MIPGPMPVPTSRRPPVASFCGMADQRVDYLLVGGGLAAAQCATELRKRGAEGSITLVGREPDPPYDRPPLSKEYLRGEGPREEYLVHDRSWYEDNDVELLTATSVMGLDIERRVAKLQGKREVEFEKALIATGAMVNILRVDGAQLDGINYLRAFGNSDAIREDVATAEHVGVIGGSYIGAEVAASLTAGGKACTIVMLEDVLLSRVFGERGRPLLPRSARVEGDPDPRRRGAGSLRSAISGSAACGPGAVASLSADAVVIGAGVKPDVMLAQRAGLEVDDGIVVDPGLETSVEGIFAAGDCAPVPGRALRRQPPHRALGRRLPAGPPCRPQHDR